MNNVTLKLNYLHMEALQKMLYVDGNSNVKTHQLDANNKKYLLICSPSYKIAMGEDYNYVFDKINGNFVRWGKTIEDNPLFSPIGPELLDCEVSINGCPNKCPFCYKNNTDKEPKNMPFDMFKKIIDSFGPQLTQVAFGITGIQTNPDLLKMFKYCREIGVIPNFTLSGIDLTEEIAKECSKFVGAIAVSAYKQDKNICYNTVKKFTDLGIKQTNIHLLVSKETLPFVYEVLNDRLNDSRLEKLNAVVFLGIKPKGRASKNFTSPSTEDYGNIIKYCFDKKISIGFDSCYAPKFDATIKQMKMDNQSKKILLECSESCESSLFSSYVNVDGFYWHCSFAENEPKYDSIDVTKINNFLDDVWYSEKVKKFRNDSINSSKDGCRFCNLFPEINS